MKHFFLLTISLAFLVFSCESYDDNIPQQHQNVGAYVLTKYEARTPVYLFNESEAHTDFREAWIEAEGFWIPESEAFRFSDYLDEHDHFMVGISYQLPTYRGYPWPFDVGIVSARFQLESRHSLTVVGGIDLSQSYNFTDLSDVDFILYEEMNPAIIEIEIIDENIIQALFLLRVFDQQLNEHVVVEVEAEFLKVRGRYRD